MQSHSVPLCIGVRDMYLHYGVKLKLHELTVYDVLSILLSTVLNSVSVCLYSQLKLAMNSSNNSADDRPPSPEILRVNAAHRSLLASFYHSNTKFYNRLEITAMESGNKKAWDQDQQCFSSWNQASGCSKQQYV